MVAPGLSGSLSSPRRRASPTGTTSSSRRDASGSSSAAGDRDVPRHPAARPVRRRAGAPRACLLAAVRAEPDVERVKYSARPGERNVVVRYRASGTRAVPGSGARSSASRSPTNDNAGHIAFGPDGRLWVQPVTAARAAIPRTGQNPDSPLGKLFRLDVKLAKPTNAELFALGLRNPWRFGFDRKTGDLWIGDVGRGDRRGRSSFAGRPAPSTSAGTSTRAAAASRRSSARVAL